MSLGSSDGKPQDIDTSKIRNWRSIVTLIVFVLTNLVVLFPFHIPLYIPRWLSNAFLDILAALRIIPHRQKRPSDYDHNGKLKAFVRLRLPLNFVTAPLIADLFLLAILAIGRQEVHDGTIGANNISPLDIMLFFISLAYIAISIDASGLIRYLAFRVLKWGGDVGHRLFFYLYTFFFVLTGFIGNDPVILSGTAFLAYMTRVSSNIKHPRAWIHAQFAVANIASAILVSSNPTNLVLAGAFNIKFINYTANIIVPVIVTGIVLFPFLLYIVFPHEDLIPSSIRMHELPVEVRDKKPVNPNIPNARGTAKEDEKAAAGDEPGQLLSLEEIMNPFLDKGGAAFGAIIMAVTLITLLALNAASSKKGEHPVFWVTLPAAVVQLAWDVAFGWKNRHETRKIAQDGRREIELAKAEREAKVAEEAQRLAEEQTARDGTTIASAEKQQEAPRYSSSNSDSISEVNLELSTQGLGIDVINNHIEGRSEERSVEPTHGKHLETDVEQQGPEHLDSIKQDRETLVSIAQKQYRWCQETFPTATTVMAHLPFALIPFAFTMFVLVQALVTKGWVPVFAYGWDHWVQKTGTIGAVGGMGFLSVVLCNFAGTNIGTTILLSRIIQAWLEIHKQNGVPISDRTFWATIYAMALGVNFGAFSAAFSASLAGLLWRDILARKHIRIRGLEFAHVNLPIIAICMIVGLVTLVGEVYIVRTNEPYKMDS